MNRITSLSPCSHRAVADSNPVEGFTGSFVGMNVAPSVCQCDMKNPKDPIGLKPRINTPFSLNTLHKVFVTFDAEKRAIVHSIGLGGLLKVHNQRLQCRDLILTLLSRMDPITGSIVLSNGVLTVDDKDVHLVLDIPYKGVEIKLSSRPAVVVDKVKLAQLLDTDAELNMEVVIGILLKDYGRKMSPTEREAFKVAAIIFADSFFLGPRGDPRKINKDILEYVADPSRIVEVNWSAYVLSVLRQSAAKIQHSSTSGQKSVILEGCLLFLLVFYLDNLSAGFLTPPYDTFPRIAKYTPHLVSELVSYDRRRRMTHSITQFGRAKLRPSADVVYSRSIATRAKNSHDSGRQDWSVMSGHKVIHVGTSHSSSPSKSQNNLQQSEAELALEEHLENFRSQVAQATDEFQRKVLILFCSFRDDRRQCSPYIHDLEVGALPDKVLHSNSSTHVEHKADFSGGYRTICISSDGSIVAPSSLVMHNAEGTELPLVSSPQSPPIFISAGGHPMTSLHDLDQGSQRSWPLVDETDGEVSMVGLNCSRQKQFGPSCFELGIKDKDTQFRAIMEVIRVLPRFSDEERKKYWYIHNVPSCIKIDGESLYSVFYSDIDFSFDIMDAVMRLYHEFDDAFYIVWPEKRWRHYLPATWAEIALAEENVWAISLVKDMINGDHLSYRVDECQLVLLPVRVLSKWALYAWDFARNQITILDPVIDTTQLLNAKHKSVAGRLHNALMGCIQEIFGQMEPLNIIWHLKYLRGIDDYPSNKSGLYTAFYSRFFDGETVTRSMIVEDSVTLFQTNLLCQLLNSSGNQGTCPMEISSAITESN